MSEAHGHGLGFGRIGEGSAVGKRLSYGIYTWVYARLALTDRSRSLLCHNRRTPLLCHDVREPPRRSRRSTLSTA